MKGTELQKLMKHNSVVAGVLLATILMGTATSSTQVAAEKLRPEEFSAVALIYDRELAALGGRALYPICVSLPTGSPNKSLLHYLRKYGFPVSDPSLCEPAMLPGGQHHPKDYPHGLRIFIGNPKRDSAGVVSMHVESDDLTLRPGEHLVGALSRGIYELSQSDKSEWQITKYTKEYDSKDNTKPNACEPSPQAAGDR